MQKRPLNVAVVARLRFIVEQTLFTLRNFTHKSANQLDIKLLKLPNFYREKQTMTSAIQQHLLQLPIATPEVRKRASAHRRACAYIAREN